MQAVLRHSQEPCDQTIPMFNGWINTCQTVCCVWGDQGALMQVLMKYPPMLSHVHLTGFRDFGSLFPWYGEGDLVVHLSGMKSEERIKILRTLLVSVNFDDGTFTRALPPSVEPQLNVDHVRGLDYSSINNLTTWEFDNQHLRERVPRRTSLAG